MHENETCWVILLDIDGVAELNERFGTEAVDDYIARLAKDLETATPGNAFRVGGGRFLVLQVGITLQIACATAEEALKRGARLSATMNTTLTIGIAGWLPAQEEFLHARFRVEDSLEQAKRRGGNTIHVHGLDE